MCRFSNSISLSLAPHRLFWNTIGLSEGPEHWIGRECSAFRFLRCLFRVLSTFERKKCDLRKFAKVSCKVYIRNFHPVCGLCRAEEKFRWFERTLVGFTFLCYEIRSLALQNPEIPGGLEILSIRAIFSTVDSRVLGVD